MLTTTVGIVMMYIALQDDEVVDIYFRRMTALGAFMQTILLIIMRAEHKGFRYTFAKRSRLIHMLLRLALAFCHLSMRWSEGDLTTQMMYHALISFTLNAVDIGVALVFGKPDHKDSEFHTRESIAGSKHEVELRNTEKGRDTYSGLH